MQFYPLVFEPIIKDRIWGGTKLQTVLGKPIPDGITHAGESWELSAVPGNVSIVKNGPLKGLALDELIKRYPREILGDHVYDRFGTEFPLLIKFIDAREDLSIQVHPDDELAQKRHNCMGKTEMWYVMDAEEGTRIIVGFKKNSSPEEYMAHLQNKTLGELLNQVPTKKGDVFFLAPGTVHAIGAGTLIAEIQQTSDITYRVYDWDRKDAEGNSRELHIDLALKAINYGMVNAHIKYDALPNRCNRIVRCLVFATNILPLNGELHIQSDPSSFRIYICTEGNYELLYRGDCYQFSQGDTVLIPASLEQLCIRGNACLLEVYIADSDHEAMPETTA